MFIPGKYYTHEMFRDVVVRCIDSVNETEGVKVTFQYWNKGQSGVPYLIVTKKGPIVTTSLIKANRFKSWSEYAFRG